MVSAKHPKFQSHIKWLQALKDLKQIEEDLTLREFSVAQREKSSFEKFLRCCQQEESISNIQQSFAAFINQPETTSSEMSEQLIQLLEQYQGPFETEQIIGAIKARQQTCKLRTQFVESMEGELDKFEKELTNTEQNIRELAKKSESLIRALKGFLEQVPVKNDEADHASITPASAVSLTDNMPFSSNNVTPDNIFSQVNLSVPNLNTASNTSIPLFDSTEKKEPSSDASSALLNTLFTPKKPNGQTKDNTLFPAQKTETANADSRKETRKPLAVTLGIKSDNNFYVGFSENISTGGIFIATHQTLSTGEKILLSFQLPDEKEPCVVHATVKWTRHFNIQSPEAQPGMGIQFDEGLSKDVEQKIRAFMNKRPPLHLEE